jgi:general secretion pathway protein C
MLQISPAPHSAKLWSGVWAALLWCAAAASAVFWLLNFPSGSAVQGVPLVQGSAQANSASSVQASVHMARVFGVQAPLPEVSIAQSSRFQLWGVVAGASGQGSALISSDGQPPKAYKVGQALEEGGWQLQYLTPKQARLVKGSAILMLELSITYSN